jgi:excisionase family DNA binding protein
MSATLTTREVAERLGVTAARVRQLVLSGDLPAEKFGRDLMIKETDLRLVADRPMGRPPKAKPAQSNGKKRGKR